MVIHVCKFDINNTSRIQMQTRWDAGRFLVLGRNVSGNHSINESQSMELRWLSILRTIRLRPVCYVFHEQSTLLYLLMMVLLRRLLSLNVKIVYDMHDLNEEEMSLSYRYIRYLVCYCLEYVVSILDVNIITVSNGLKDMFYARYRYCKDVNVVYNISADVKAADLADRDYSGKIIYFGQIDLTRVTMRLLSNIEKNGLTIYLHGTVNDNLETGRLLKRYVDFGTVKMMGPYKASDLSFLNGYSYSVIDYSLNDTSNIKYCLPNKLFQSIRYGLVCLVSDNLQEVGELFNDYTNNVVMMKNSDNIGDIIKNSEDGSGINIDCDNSVNDYLDKLVLRSRNNYLNAVSS